MKLWKLASVTSALVLSTSVNAAIIYQFDFTNLSGFYYGTVEEFSVSLSYPDVVTTSGMSALVSTPLTYYPVSYAGTNNRGWWGFDDDEDSSMTDDIFIYSEKSFLFRPDNDLWLGGYLTVPGTYVGSVNGNYFNNFFYGDALLTITDTNTVPIPAAVWLFGSGLIGLVGFARRKKV
ncbi:hypothetical protein MNBD_BACTEROID05-118 [hydrothermal vent metagenome]|uniref:PEP-CTERM protein-sorting domain-containing protein n=1 Tax=hydrothermal vent metagenome TaxID=652676 RepID=A0A3B0U1R4_9ZZZZ